MNTVNVLTKLILSLFFSIFNRLMVPLERQLIKQKMYFYMTPVVITRVETFGFNPG